ncbi:hypothetical protein RD792_009687 [Penstemon davidsonii]|uniref:Uncharacterized protein n=1 Tax=Penstemon davidsonii TaxID=160366 RepID=A0ABR0D1L6_9LAMI|nr:hypothetical protein RD792_009687 [Penstemon davidsonii]
MASAININVEKEIARPEANFSPSLWGDQFINYTFDTQEAEKYTKEIDVLKDEVKSMLETKMVQAEAMNLIDTLERLGISYHFENEIEEKLQQFFNLNTDYESYDLYTVALHFRLFRQHGHRISSEIFSKFLDGNGKFQEELKSDVKGLLSLYEASYLRIHGENILEEALVFTTTNLKSLAPNLRTNQVLHSLYQPLHLGNPRIESRHFISTYEENESKLLKFAKLDYNLLQMLHKNELLEVSRDRLVECFLFAMGTYHEPKYSRARVMLAKTIIMTSAIDDTYDAYGTIEELDVFTEAIQGWNISEINRLPEYMKPLYKALLELYEQFDEELSKEERSYAIPYAIESLKELVRCYQIEAKWFIKGYLPTFEEYLNNALITCTNIYHTATGLLGAKSSTKEDYEWLSKKPKLLVDSLIFCRAMDDIATYEVEKARGQTATGIECYMKDNGVTKQEAMDKFVEIAKDAWKDMNEGCLNLYSSYSRDVLTVILNLGRIVDVVYKNAEDGYTQPEKFVKHRIIALFVNPIKIHD